MWLSVWLACSIAACAPTSADPAPAPAPLVHPPRSEEASGAEGNAVTSPPRAGAGASAAVSSYGWHENVRDGGRDGQFYVQIQDDGGAGSQHRVQYTADADGYHPLVQYRAVGAQHEVTSSFALGERAVQLLHATRQSNAQQAQPTPTPINDASAPGSSPGPEAHPPDARDYYLVTQQFLTSPGYLNAQFQDIPLFSTQESNSNALAVTNIEPVVTPIQYFVQHPTHKQQSRPDAHSAEKQKEKEFQISSPVEDTNSHSQDKSDQLTTPLIQVFTNNCTESSEQDTSSEAPPSERQSSRLYADVPNYREKNYNYDQSVGAKVSSRSENGNKESKRDRINYRSERVYYPRSQPKSALTTVPPQNNVTEGISRLVASTQNLISNDDVLDINNAAEDESPVGSDDMIKPQPKQKITKLYPTTNIRDTDRSEITVSAKIGRLVDSISEHEENAYVDNLQRWTSNNQDQYRFATPIVVQGSTVTDVKSQIVENLMATVVPYLEQGYELSAVKNDLKEQSPKEQQQTNEEDETEDNYEDPIEVTPRPVSQKFLAPLTVGLTLIYSNNTDVLDNVLDHDVSDSELVSDSVNPEEKESVRQGKTIVEVQPSIPIEFTEINDIVIKYDDSRDGKRNEELKALQNRFNNALESSKKIQNNINENLYRFGAQQVLIHPDQYRRKLEAEEKAQQDQENRNFEENDKPMDAQTDIDVNEQQESQHNERKEYVSAYNNHFGDKIIQPIIIEKEVPVTKFVDRFIEKKVPYPEPVEVVKEVPVEKPVPYPVTVEKYINRPVEVTRYVDRPRNVFIQQPYEVKVPYVFENKIYIDRPIPVPVDRVVEKQVPVPTPVGVPFPVEKAVYYPIEVGKPYPVPYAVDRPFPVDRVVEKQVPVPYLVEKKIPVPVGIPIDTKVPVPYPVEKPIPYPVDRIVEKPVTITKYVDKPVQVEVPVPHPVPIPVPQPYPVDRIVEKRIPYPVDRIVEKIVTKYVNKPYPVETRVPYPVPYEKVVEKKVPYPVEVRVPYEVRIPYQVAKPQENVSYNSDKVASYAIPGPPYQHPPVSNNLYGQSAPQNYIAAKNSENAYTRHPNVYVTNQKPLLINTYNLQNNNAFIPASPSQSVEPNNSNVKSVHWGNLYSSSYQYIKPNTSTYQKSPNHDKYTSYLADNSQYAGNRPQPNQVYASNNPWSQPRVVEWKLRRTDRTLKVSPLNIEYGGFKPPLVPSTEVDLDGLPVKTED